MIRDLIYSSLDKPLHFSVIDPDPKKIGDIKKKSILLEKAGTDAVMLGGSTNIQQEVVDNAAISIKENTSLPVICFPSRVSGISKHADAVFFMSLLNSKNPYWITKIQSEAAIVLKQSNLEIIPLAYLITEPGMKVGEVGEADLIKDAKTAVGYALTAQYFGMDIVFLEAGSGSDKPVQSDIIREVKNNIGIPLLVSGGFSARGDLVKKSLEAGANIIGTGNLTEENINKLKKIIKTVKEFKV